MFAKMRIGSRLMILFIVIGIVPLVVLGWHVRQIAEESLLSSTFAHLESIREIKKARIESYFIGSRRDLEVIASTIKMIRDQANDDLKEFVGVTKGDIEKYFHGMRQSMRLLRDDSGLLHALREMRASYADSGRQIDAMACREQAARLAPRLRNLVENLQVDDLFLLDRDGEILLTHGQHGEMGRNPLGGAWGETPLGTALRQVMDHPDPGFVAVADLAPWDPAQGAQVGFFVGRLSTEGFVVLRFDAERIDAVLARAQETIEQLHSRDARYRSGTKTDVRVVGRTDGAPTLRSDRSGGRQRSSDPLEGALYERVLTSAVGDEIYRNEGGEMALAVHARLAIPGLAWGIVVSRSLEEALGLGPKQENAEFLRQFIKAYVHHDLLLIARNGTVFHSVAREDDYGSDMLAGRYRESNLGRLLRNILQTESFDFVDYEPYAPSNGKPSAFIGMPLLRQGQVEMMLVLQLSLEWVQRVMDQREGMGASGESYLVGPDHRMRSNARNDPVNRTVAASFVGSARHNGVEGEAVREALAGRSGIGLFNNYAGRGVLEAYVPVTMGPVTWALLVDIDEEEVQAPVRALMRAILVSGGMLILLVTLIALWTGRAFVAPLRELMGAAARISSGDFAARVGIRGGGEFADLGRMFNGMAASSEEHLWLQTHLARVTALVQESTREPDLAQSLIGYLAPLLGAGHGACHVCDPATGRYELRGGYGLLPRHASNTSFAVGEGLVGQCVVERRIVLLTHAPADYVKIGSGLGEGTPVQLLLVPMLFRESVLAVVELATFEEFTATHRALMEALRGPVGMGIANLQKSIHTRELLEETRVQSEELAAQQEELRRNNEELQEQQRELERSREAVEGKIRDLALASRYKSEFLANMSHELRTPLNSLLLLSRMLSANRTGNLTEEQVQSIRIIHEGGAELLALINDILDLSKIEAGRMEVMVDTVDVRGWRERLLGQFAPLFREKGVGFEVILEPDAPTAIRTDEVKMGRVVKNFLANAGKFTERGGVTVRIGSPAGERCGQEGGVRFVEGNAWARMVLSISVADTGIGIEREKLALIFEAFQQADGGTSRRYGGTGLGLAIARELTRLLDGQLWARSQEGEGSEFVLCLPNLDDGIPPLPEPPATGTEPTFLPDEHAGPKPGEKVMLVIEEDGRFAAVLCSQARKYGFQAIAARDGESGLGMAARFRPAGIILDRSTLPGMSGEEVLERLRANPSTATIPVQIVSAVEYGVQTLSGEGVVGVLIKPVTGEQIHEVCVRLECGSHAAGRGVLLLVEEKPGDAMLASTFFQEQGIEVVVVRTGEEALRMLEERLFSCMVLDLDLPGQGGFALLEQLEARGVAHKPALIVFSGHPLDSAEYQRLRQYTDSVLLKGGEAGERLRQEVGNFLANLHAAPEVVESSVAAEACFSGEKILLVDDDMRNLFAMSRLLQSLGLFVILSPDGRRALELLEANADVRLVLMDVMMPVMDGLEAIRQIRARESLRHLPIVVLSAKAMLEDQEKGLAAGADAFLVKPVEMDPLLDLLRRYLRS
ncbi:MAG: response regulator [Magnetococcales bacterium]|nr:response regulator [Magnetococcales bacterium]